MTQSAMRGGDSEEMQRVLHDLSNTLTGLLMNAGLLSLALRSNERLRRYADDIYESATRGAELLRHARSIMECCEVAPELESRVTDACDPSHTPGTTELRRKRGSYSTRTQ
jgi:signal transduction histidine kinase